MGTLYIRKKITEKWSIPAKLLIFRQPKALESLNWYQMIAMTIFYNHVIWYINKLTSLFLIFKENLRYRRKNAGKRRGYTNKIANILVIKSSRELKSVSNDCYNNIL